MHNTKFDHLLDVLRSPNCLQDISWLADHLLTKAKEVAGFLDLIWEASVSCCDSERLSRDPDGNLSH